MEKNSVIFLAPPASLEEEMRHYLSRRRFSGADTGGDFLGGEDSGDENENGADETAAGETAAFAFEVDPGICLPVEMEPGASVLDPEKLSWETILSGMLRVIAERAGRESSGSRKIRNGDILSPGEMDGIPAGWVDYYRVFVITVKPEIFREFTGAAIVKAGNGEFDLALEISAILEGLFPFSPGVLLNKALILERKTAAPENGSSGEAGNDAALEAYERVLSLEPVLPDALFNGGFFFLNRGDFARAGDCFSRYVSLDGESGLFPEIPEDKKKQAEKILKDLGGRGLDDDSFREARESIDRGDNEDGLLKIRGFIEKYPKVWNGWFVLGWALRKLGRFADALEAFGMAAELGGANCDILNETAICLMERGDLAGARKKLEEALRTESENVKIISNLGVLALKAGRRGEAEAFFRTVLELDPGDPVARKFLEGGRESGASE